MGLKTSEHSGKKQAPLSRRNDEESQNMNEGERGGMIKTLNPKQTKLKEASVLFIWCSLVSAIVHYEFRRPSVSAGQDGTKSTT